MPNKKKQRRYGWHFASSTLRDGSPLPKVGEWEVFKGEVVMCESGLHVGITPWDALQYAPGANLRLVEFDQVEAEQDDKIVCRRRSTIAQFDATEVLFYFARLQAIGVLEHWDTEPPEVVLDYLATGDDSLRAAAWAAAWAAARAAAWDAAWAAARAAAGAAAGDAAWAAARAAARAAAWAAARAAAWAAARAAAGELFNQLVYECFEGPMKEVGFHA